MTMSIKESLLDEFPYLSTEDIEILKKLLEEIDFNDEKSGLKEFYDMVFCMESFCINHRCNLIESMFNRLEDKKWATEKLQKLLEESEGFDDLIDIGKTIIKTIKDKNWAEEIYRKSEALSEGGSEYYRLLYRIVEDLQDKEWARRLSRKTVAESKSSILKEEYMPRDLSEIIEIITDFLKDESYAKEVINEFLALKQNLEAEYLADMGISVIKYLKDEEWGKEILEESFNQAKAAQDFIDISRECSFILQYNEWGKEFLGKVLSKAEEKATTSDEFTRVGTDISLALEDKNWAKTVFKQAEKRAKTFDEYLSLSESVIGRPLEDDAWGIKLFKKTAKKAKTDYEYYYMAACMERFVHDPKLISDTIGKKNLLKAEENIATDKEFSEACFLHNFGPDFIELYNSDPEFRAKVDQTPEEKSADS